MIFNDFIKICFTVCHCGRSQRQVPCTRENSMVVYYDCGKLCGRKLSCENHSCQKLCHSGQCEPCEVLAIDKCPCGKRYLTQDELIDRKSCAQPIPTCDQLCGKPLECGPPGTIHNILVHYLFIYLFIDLIV